MHNAPLLKKNLVHFSLIFVFFIFYLPFLSNPVKASFENLVISEVMFSPEGSDTDFEWIEIFNNSDQEIEIIGSNKAESLIVIDGTDERKIAESAFQGDMFLGKNEYLILARNPAKFLERYFDYKGDLIEISGLSLKNSGDTIGLKINGESTLLDELIYGEDWLSEDGRSIEKVKIEEENTQTNWTSSLKMGGSPGEKYEENKKPVADFDCDLEIDVGKELEFEGGNSHDLDGEIIKFEWDFGDGETGEGESVSHIYESAGSYEVVLIVTDNLGEQGEKRQEIEVLEIVYPEGIILSEFLAYPGSEIDWDNSGEANYTDEWIEIFNQNKEEIDLSGWYLDDEEGGSKAFKIPEETYIKAKSYLVFYRLQTGIALNNDEDKVRLLNPNEELKEEYFYEKMKKETIWVKDSSGNWQITETGTPGKENIITFSEEEETNEKKETEENEEEKILTEELQEKLEKISIGKAREKNLESKVLIEAVVTATPEILGALVLYLEDDSGGMKIKLLDEDYSTISLGDRISVSGVLKESYNERYLKMEEDSEFEILAHEEGKNPKRMATGKISENEEGELIYVNAKISKTSGDTFYLDDGSGEVKVYIKESTGIDKPKMRAGYYALIIGIVSQYKDDYRILPRYQNDIVVSESPIDEGVVLGTMILPKTGGNGWSLGLLFIAFSLILKFHLARRQV